VTRAGPRGRTSAPESRLARWLERLAILLAALALSVGLIILLSGFFAGRDQAGVSGAEAGPGQAFADLGHAALRPGQPRPAYDSNPPTSGAHVAEAVSRAGAPLNVDQLLSALQVGDVVILYGGSRPPAAMEQLARSMAPPFSPELAAAGDAVILARRPGTAGVLALAWAHMLRAPQATDPRLREFVGFWLGRGAPGQSG
jgi:hypothetical protein